MSINNKLVRLDALCVIEFYSHSDYYQLRVENDKSLQQEIEYQFNEIYSTLPFLLHTTIFIRCLPLLQDQQMMNECLQNLFNKFVNADREDQEAVYEALSPYLQSHRIISSMLEYISNESVGYKGITNNKSSVFMEYLNKKIDEDLSSLLIISNTSLAELTSDFHEYLAADYHDAFMLNFNSHAIDKLLETTLFEFESSLLTISQALMISNIILYISSSNQSKNSEKVCVMLNNALHRFDLVEFKACRLVESWMKWKDSNELCSFAYQAALLLANSDLWSVEAATIICDLLCCENDRFRQRAEIVLRTRSDDNDIRTGAKLGIDVLLTLTMKKARYVYSSPSANLTLLRIFESITFDIRAHLNTYLWLERYRVYAFANRDYSLDKSKPSPISHVASYFPNDITINVSFCDTIRLIPSDLIEYMCDLIKSNFSSFLEIDGDITSNAVVESHVQFVVSVLILVGTLFDYTADTRALVSKALIALLETSTRTEIREAALYALGYICNERTYKILFNRLEAAMNNEAIEDPSYSDGILKNLISSYCHCISIREIEFKQEDIDLFRKLLKHPSENVLNATYTGLGRVLKDKILLFEMLGCDYIQCYHALMSATAYLLIYDPWESSVDAVADLIEQHPDLLPIFVIELYHSIRHFTDNVIYIKTIDYCLLYGNRRYVEVASLIAVRMPATFCAYIKDWRDGDNLKHALFYTSKQHDFPQRAACITVLSIFGELTVELCEMIIEGLRDDPHIQNACYKCLTRINAIQDEKAVLNLLFSYLKSKSMNTRYVTAKMLLHLSKSSLISSNQVQTALNELISDPYSNEDLWLIKEQDVIIADCTYYYAGPLKDVIYCLLVQHLTGDASGTIRRNELNDINSNFVESKNASRLASCHYEAKAAENIEADLPSVTKVID